MSKSLRKNLPWLVLILVVIVAFAVGAQKSTPKSVEARTTAVASTLRCPVCSGESVADSQAPVAKSILAEVRTRVQMGESAATIRGYFVSKYGQAILLAPPARGVSLIVWLIPALIVGVAVGIVGSAIGRWRVNAVPVLAADQLSQIEREIRK